MKKILFVCVENAGRSQMAEAFFKKYLPLGFQPISAGTKPAVRINPVIIQVMKEVGIDIRNNSPQNISQQMIDESEIAINMGYSIFLCLSRLNHSDSMATTPTFVAIKMVSIAIKTEFDSFLCLQQTDYFGIEAVSTDNG